ncbi:MAG: hypothetical protein JOS17DRAFT_745561 [Linnemannia elongata]|nr:MAG: hypothetical protein JOS17DRAFT_745561 [Linnemannia elongata]
MNVRLWVLIPAKDISLVVASAGVAEAHALHGWLEIGLAVVNAVDASVGTAVSVALLEIDCNGTGLDLRHDGHDGEDYQGGKILGDEHFEIRWTERTGSVFVESRCVCGGCEQVGGRSESGEGALLLYFANVYKDIAVTR